MCHHLSTKFVMIIIVKILKLMSHVSRFELSKFFFNLNVVVRKIETWEKHFLILLYKYVTFYDISPLNLQLFTPEQNGNVKLVPTYNHSKRGQESFKNKKCPMWWLSRATIVLLVVQINLLLSKSMIEDKYLILI